MIRKNRGKVRKALPVDGVMAVVFLEVRLPIGSKDIAVGRCRPAL